MATFYIDGSSATNGVGTEGDPYNAVPGNALTTANTWLFKRGSTLNLGAGQLSCGNNPTVGAYGTGARPIIMTTLDALICDAASNAVLIEDIHFLKSGVSAGTAVKCGFMQGVNSRFTMRRCRIEGFSSGVIGDRSLRVTLEGNEFVGDSSAFAVYGRANSNQNCDDWVIVGNTFSVGSSLFFATSGTTTSTGAVNNLQIKGNTFTGDNSNTINLGCPTSQNNSALYVQVTAPNTVQAFTDPGGTIPAVLPAWPNGAKVFFAGFSDKANFGLFTVNTLTSNTLVVQETSLVTEALGRNKGIHHRDPFRAFNNLVIEENVLVSPGATPMNLNAVVGGSVRRNTITDGRGVGKVSAGIELINCLNLAVYLNKIVGLTVNSGVQTVDGMGIMIDGASENCVAWGNIISGLSGLPGVANSGAGIALFECKNCSFFSNLVYGNFKGAWVGGPGTSGHIRNNTLAANATGVDVNSSPAAATIVFTNNLLTANTIIGSVSAAAAPSYNWFWANSGGVAFGTNQLSSNPQMTANYRPLPGSPLLSGGADLGPVRDVEGKQDRKVVGAYGQASLFKK